MMIANFTNRRSSNDHNSCQSSVIKPPGFPLLAMDTGRRQYDEIVLLSTKPQQGKKS